MRQKLKELLNRTSGWSSGLYTLDHNSGISLWVGNGFWFFDFYPETLKAMSFLDKVVLWPLAKRLKRNIMQDKIVAALSGNNGKASNKGLANV